MPSLPEFIPKYQNVIVLYWNMTEIIITTLLASGAAVGTSIPSSPSLCCESTVPSTSKKIARMLRHSLNRRWCYWCTCCIAVSPSDKLMDPLSFSSSLRSGVLRRSSSGLRPTGDLSPGDEVLNTAGPPLGGGISIPIRRYFLRLLLIHVCQWAKKDNTENFPKFEDTHLIFLNKMSTLIYSKSNYRKKYISDS